MNPSTHPSRAQSPQPQPQPQSRLNLWNRYPRASSALLSALVTAPASVLTYQFRKPIAKFVTNVGRYSGRVAHNVFKAIKDTPFGDDKSPSSQGYYKQHINTIVEKKN